jgi:phosphoenolpyruvate carboxylase
MSVATAERTPPRVPASLLQEVCRVLLPGYSAARREPERLAVLTRACLERTTPVHQNGNLPAAADEFDRLARAILLQNEPAGGTLLVTDAERASDVLCALWLARRSGLFRPGSSTAEASGKRSHLELIPTFSVHVPTEEAAAAMATLYANEAFRRHLEARGRARMLALAAAVA